MFGYNEKITSTPCEEGVSRKLLNYSRNLMMTEVLFKKGACGRAHSHPHEQITYVAKGRFLFSVGEESGEVRTGDSIIIPPGVPHETTALEDGILVDVFSPLREDFLS